MYTSCVARQIATRLLSQSGRENPDKSARRGEPFKENFLFYWAVGVCVKSESQSGKVFVHRPRNASFFALKGKSIMTKNTNIAAEIAILAETPDPERIAAGVSEAARQVIKEAAELGNITLAELIAFVEGHAQEPARSETLAAINALHNAKKEYTGLQVEYILDLYRKEVIVEFSRLFGKSAMQPDDFNDFIENLSRGDSCISYLEEYDSSNFFNRLECVNVMEPLGYRLDRDNKYVERAKHSA